VYVGEQTSGRPEPSKESMRALTMAEGWTLTDDGSLHARTACSFVFGIVSVRCGQMDWIDPE
jgi:hypothetical protein